MHALGHRVRRQDELVTGWRAEQRAIVAQAESAGKALGKGREVALDDRLLAGDRPLLLRHRREPAGSARTRARAAGAMRSRMPLTTFGSSSSKKAWATLMYSLMTTRAGTSARSRSSKEPARRIARRIESTRTSRQPVASC